MLEISCGGSNDNDTNKIVQMCRLINSCHGLVYIPVSKATDGSVPDKEMSVTGGYFQSGKPGSGKEKRTLNAVKTHFYVGTEVTLY